MPNKMDDQKKSARECQCDELIALVERFFQTHGSESLQTDLFYWLKCAISSAEIESIDTLERSQLMDTYWGVWNLMRNMEKIMKP